MTYSMTLTTEGLGHPQERAVVCFVYTSESRLNKYKSADFVQTLKVKQASGY